MNGCSVTSLPNLGATGEGSRTAVRAAPFKQWARVSLDLAKGFPDIGLLGVDDWNEMADSV
jgi:hypothetical protein